MFYVNDEPEGFFFHSEMKLYCMVLYSIPMVYVPLFGCATVVTDIDLMHLKGVH